MKVTVLIALIIVLIGTAFFVFVDVDIENLFKPDPYAELRELMEDADRIELIGVYPIVYDPEGAPKGAEHLEPVEDGVITKRKMLTPEERERVVDEFWRNVDGAGEDAGAMACFIPRHGLLVYKGDKRYDVIICYECEQVWTEGLELELPPIEGQPREMDRILKTLPMLTERRTRRHSEGVAKPRGEDFEVSTARSGCATEKPGRKERSD